MKVILGSSAPLHMEALRKSSYPFQSIEVEVNERPFAHLSPSDRAKEISKAKCETLLKAFRSNSSVVIVTIHQEMDEEKNCPVTAMTLFRPGSAGSKGCRYIRIDNTTKLGHFPMTNMRQTLGVLGFQLAKAA